MQYEYVAEIHAPAAAGRRGGLTMFGIETLDGPASAAALVALVFVEAMLLYVGYGALTTALGEKLTGLLRGD